jgi:hypothetical protein
MYERATTLPAPIGIFIEADQDGNNLKQWPRQYVYGY